MPPLFQSCGLFVHYLTRVTSIFVRDTNPNDILLSLGLYVIYPAILWLLLEKFHGLCGPNTYLRKLPAIEACSNIYLYFTVLLRTYKFGVIVLYSVDASNKLGGSDPDLSSEDRSSSRSRGGFVGRCLSNLKCQTWMHLSHEMMLISLVAFLLLVCLPVLAFWVMFTSILVSTGSLIQLIRRMWQESQRSDDDDDDDGAPTEEHSDGGSRRRPVTNETGGDGNSDLEFQAFLSNFAEPSNTSGTKS